MRVLLAIALLAFSNVGVIAASSTDDLCVVASNYRRALPPLNHYFPTTGMKPKVGHGRLDEALNELDESRKEIGASEFCLRLEKGIRGKVEW